jgi:hypothetical protein
VDVVRLLIHLNGNEPKTVVTINGDNNVVIFNQNGEQMIANSQIYSLASNDSFHRQIKKVVMPLKKPKRTLDINKNRDHLQTIRSTDYNATIRNPTSKDELTNINTIDATLKVVRPHFEKDESWIFRWGRNQITAKIEDFAFLQRVRDGDQSFRSGDVFRVRLRIEETQKEHKILKFMFVEEVQIPNI